MLKVLSLFSGIGAFEKALDNLEVPYDLVAFCEFDKYAVKSYCAIHNVEESKNLGDITKVDEKTLPVNVVDIAKIFHWLENKKVFSMKTEHKQGQDCSLKHYELSKQPNPKLLLQKM